MTQAYLAELKGHSVKGFLDARWILIQGKEFNTGATELRIPQTDSKHHTIKLALEAVYHFRVLQQTGRLFA